MADQVLHVVTYCPGTNILAGAHAPIEPRHGNEDAIRFLVGRYCNAGEGLSIARPLSDLDPYTRADIRRYKRLSDLDKAYVAAYETMLIHELGHAMDLLTTPLGANYYFNLCVEHIMLGGCLKELMNGSFDISMPLIEVWPDATRGIKGRHLNDSGSTKDAAEAMGHLYSLAGAASRWFWSDERVNPRHFKPGWSLHDHDPSHPSVWTLLGRHTTPVRVLGDFSTLLLPSTSNLFLRRTTVLESRAVIRSLRFLLYRFQRNPRLGLVEAARYLETWYPLVSSPDYRYLLDLFATVTGHDSIESAFLADPDPANWERLLEILDWIVWFSLHDGDCVKRLVCALGGLHGLIADGKSLNVDIVLNDLSDTYDDGERTIEARLESAGDMCALARELNEVMNPHPPLATHFDRVLGLCEGDLRGRMGHGYASWNGPALGGFFGLDSERRPPTDLFSHLARYEAHPSVSHWIRLKRHMLFKRDRDRGESKRLAIQAFLTDLDRAPQAAGSGSGSEVPHQPVP